MTQQLPNQTNDDLLRDLLLEKYEPIAIVGIGLRLPGGNETPEDFADFLRSGQSGTGPIPADRWDVDGLHSDDADEKGTVRTAGGGFLTGMDEFDPKFFNISPKEAGYVDPQHRLVLECAWKALEHANIDPATLRDGNGGVYLGISSMDYTIEVDRLDPTDLTSYIAAGTAHSAMSGRLSYFLGWRGPCMSIDTACSSSLVALHLAVQGLRRGECDIALFGGVNAVHHPRNHVVFSEANMLAADGRCKTFDDKADGYSRSEGCGVMVLKRFSDAKRAGDTVLALVRGSSVRQDGESGGLTVPNGTAQTLLMREALASAMLDPADVQYVEAHGTGTSLGDPIEMGAIDAVLSAAHADGEPVLVGSVKTNIGHMEAAAGVGGVIKTVLQLGEAVIFPHINLDTPSRHIPWDRYHVHVPTSPTPWPAQTRRALVNSFGFAGTIATVVLEQAPPTRRPLASSAAEEQVIFTLSARSQPALRALAERYRTLLTEQPDLSVADICYTANIGRTHFTVRSAGLVSSRTDLEALLDRQQNAAPAKSPAEPAEEGEFRGGNVAFLFTGQGSQYPGMGAALYAQYPVFQHYYDECDRLFTPLLGRSIKALVFGTDGTDGRDIHQTAFTQPALFALEYALAQLWISWGIRPTVLLGHSIGEIVAACLAGLFSLPDAITLVSARARLMQSVRTPGGMIAVRAPAADVAPLLKEYPDVSFGAINAPEQCVVSGGVAALAAITAELTARDIKVTPLPVSHAFHSPLMAEVFDAFRAALSGIQFREPELSFVSNLTGAVASLADVGNPDYWVRHIGEPVNFAAGMRCVRARGRHVFVEIGPSATLSGMGKQCGDPAPHLWLSSLNAEDTDGSTIRRSLVRCYTAGLAVEWAGYHDGRPRRRITLPAYAFDKKRYWLPVSPSGGRFTSKTAVGASEHHPLLGADVSTERQLATGAREFVTRLSPQTPSYLVDHVVMGQTVFPGAGYVEVLFALQDAVFGETARPVQDVAIHEPLFLPEDTATEVRTRLARDADGIWRAEIVSRLAGRDGAAIERRHVTAILGADADAAASSADLIAELRERESQRGAPIAVHRADDLYADFAELGLPYGPNFRRIRTVDQHEDGFAVGDLRGLDTATVGHLHPAVLDCAMQTLAAVAELGDTYLPVGFARVCLLKKPKGELRTLLRLNRQQNATGPAAELTADLVVLDDDRPVFAVHEVRLKRVANTAGVPGSGLLHQPRWLRRSHVKAGTDVDREVLVVNRAEADLAPIAAPLAEAGVRLHFTADPARLRTLLTERQSITDLHWFWRTAPQLTGAERLRAETELNYRDLLTVVAQVDGLGVGRDLRITLITEAAQLLPGDVTADRDDASLIAASVWGFGHVLLNEHPALRATLLDLPGSGSGQLPPSGSGQLQPIVGSLQLQPIVDELLAGDSGADEFQVAYRAGVRFVRRVVPQSTGPSSDENFELTITEYGQFANIKPVSVPEVEPVGDEITVRIEAAGLNFKDVLNALGLLKQYAADQGIEYRPLPLGFEAAGTVIATGPQAQFAVGDEVVLSQLGCMRRRMTVSSTVAVRKPAAISFAEAAGLSAAYVTAYYALHNLAGIKAGDKVLIHAAAGGVGQAAVQLAKLAGAEVFATASPRKWPLLRAQGIKHIMNSRTLDFSAEVLRLTDGNGVDVVLNSLNKDYVPASLRTLGTDGRFVELGKIGVWSTEQVRIARPDVDYHNFDLSEFAPDELNRLNKHLLSTVVDLIDAGSITALPTVTYALDEVEEAFGVLSRGANTGKLVLSFAADRPTERPLVLDENHTYLLTGGLGALGIVTARELVRIGARHLAIVTRRPITDADRAAFATAIGASADVELTVVQGDVAVAADVARIMTEIADSGHPLGGVIHAAGVLADAPITNQSWASIERVLAPKIIGAWLLHQATKNLPTVRFFVTYSSVASIIGAAGQSNYAAGNAYLDALMQWRVSLGLPGLSVNWGPWSQVGMAANLSAAQIRGIEERGIKFVTPATATRALIKAIGRGVPQSIVGEFDWDRFAAAQPISDALYRQMLSHEAAPVQRVDIDELLRLNRADRDAQIRTILRAKVAAVLHFDSVDDIETDARFVELGLDSLAAVELKNALESVFQVPLPTSILFDYPAVGTLADFISLQFIPAEQLGVAEQVGAQELDDSAADAELAALRDLV